MPLQKTNKNEIIGKSLEVFRAKGYHNTSMTDLAEACGLLKGSFYHYFESKEALLQAILLDVEEYMKERIFPIVADESLSHKERMAKIFQKLGKLLLKAESGCFVGNITLETVHLYPSIKEILSRIFQIWIDNTAVLYASEYTLEESQLLAEQTIMEFEGAMMLSKLYNGELRFFKDCYLRALGRFKN
jgi:AcrR family transcriptional regulator